MEAKGRIGDWEAGTIVDKGRRGAISSVIFPTFRSASCVCLRIPFEKVLPPHLDVAQLGHVVDENPVMERDRRLRVGHGIIFQSASQTLRHCSAPFGGGASSDERIRNLSSTLYIKQGSKVRIARAKICEMDFCYTLGMAGSVTK